MRQVYAIGLQEPFNADGMRQLLAEELPQEDLRGFSDEDLEKMFDKGLRMPGLLRFADWALLEKPPALPEGLIRFLLAKSKSGALTAGTGGSCSVCGTPCTGCFFAGACKRYDC